MNKFIDEIRSWPHSDEGFLGYSEDEIGQIERLYGILVRGQLREFLLAAGRAGGVLFGDDPIILYREAWSVRTQILFQVKLFTALQDIKAWGSINKPFAVSWESETQYYYLQTKSEKCDVVYHYDENDELVRSTDMSLFEYLRDVHNRYGPRRAECRGELLKI